MTVAATPASADPAGPTNYRSEVTSVNPESPGLEARVVGGDAFLEVTVLPGTSALVQGYEGEPYLRFDPDGRVWANRSSPAFWVNMDRNGLSPVPATASPDATPEWVQVADGGSWSWHDHRIHWMSPDPPPTVGGDTEHEVLTWRVPIEVDGKPATILGKLTWFPSLPAWPWALVATAVFALLVWQGSRWVVIPAALAATAAAALGLEVAQVTATPAGAGADALSIGVVAMSLVAAVGALGAKSRQPRLADDLILLCAILMLVWSLRRIGAFAAPVLPIPVPEALARAVLAASLGTSVAGIVVSFRRRVRSAQSVGSSLQEPQPEG
jgi:hypothetical protein